MLSFLSLTNCYTYRKCVFGEIPSLVDTGIPALPRHSHPGVSPLLAHWSQLLLTSSLLHIPLPIPPYLLVFSFDPCLFSTVIATDISILALIIFLSITPSFAISCTQTWYFRYGYQGDCGPS